MLARRSRLRRHYRRGRCTICAVRPQTGRRQVARVIATGCRVHGRSEIMRLRRRQRQHQPRPAVPAYSGGYTLDIGNDRSIPLQLGAHLHLARYRKDVAPVAELGPSMATCRCPRARISNRCPGGSGHQCLRRHLRTGRVRCSLGWDRQGAVTAARSRAPRPRKPGLEAEPGRPDGRSWREPWWNAGRRARPQRRAAQAASPWRDPRAACVREVLDLRLPAFRFLLSSSLHGPD